MEVIVKSRIFEPYSILCCTYCDVDFDGTPEENAVFKSRWKMQKQLNQEYIQGRIDEVDRMIKKDSETLHQLRQDLAKAKKARPWYRFWQDKIEKDIIKSYRQTKKRQLRHRTRKLEILENYDLSVADYEGINFLLKQYGFTLKNHYEGDNLNMVDVWEGSLYPEFEN